MAEYIERKAAMIVCDEHYRECLRMQNWAGDSVAYNIADDIRELPAADVVEVVRCKDCVYRHLTGKAPFMFYTCTVAEGLNVCRDDAFCSYGERRSE